LLVFASIVFIPSLTYAQASIAGIAKDASGAVLPGVTVEASSPALIERTRSVVTDGTGQYKIVDLRPGTYTVTFALQGFSTVKREGVELSGAFTATVNADLRVGAVEETITVSGETPIVDIQNTTRQQVLDHAVIDAVPTGRNLQNLGVILAGVNVSGGLTLNGVGTQDVGGSSGNAVSQLASHGGRGLDRAGVVGVEDPGQPPERVPGLGVPGGQADSGERDGEHRGRGGQRGEQAGAAALPDPGRLHGL